MLSTSICGPLCQHPGCWNAKKKPPLEDIPEMLSPCPSKGDSLDDLPKLSVSNFDPGNTLQRHRSLPPLSRSHVTFEIPSGKPHSSFHCFRPKEIEVPRVSHIIVQAGFQCHMQKRWVWLPSAPNASPSHKSMFTTKPQYKDMTNELIQSRPASSKTPPRNAQTRNIQTRIFNSRPKGTSYLDLVRKVGYLNLLDLPHHLQVKLLENAQFRKILTSHPIDHLPYNSLPESALLDLVRCQMSPQLPNNPSLEGVGIFFDPPDDMGSKPEYRAPVVSRRPDGPAIPSTYVPTHKVLPASDLPGPVVGPAVQPQPSFREYVLSRQSATSTMSEHLPIRVETNIIDATVSSTHRTSSEAVTAAVSHSTLPYSHISATSLPHTGTCSSLSSIQVTVRTASPESEQDEDDVEEEGVKIPSKLEIILPEDSEGIRIPSAIEDDELELAALLPSSVPPTRDSWRGTAFSTVTPLSPSMITPLNGERTQVMSPLDDNDVAYSENTRRTTYTDSRAEEVYSDNRTYTGDDGAYTGQEGAYSGQEGAYSGQEGAYSGQEGVYSETQGSGPYSQATGVYITDGQYSEGIQNVYSAMDDEPIKSPEIKPPTSTPNDDRRSPERVTSPVQPDPLPTQPDPLPSSVQPDPLPSPVQPDPLPSPDKDPVPDSTEGAEEEASPVEEVPQTE